MRQMKSILRRGTALFTACLLGCACSITAFAVGADGSDDGTVTLYKSIIPGDYSDDGGTLTVHVAVNEAATDGVLTVSYDPAVLSITSDGITVTELAAMHSENVTHSGELKVGFIADGAQETGDVAVLHFKVLDANTETELVLSAEVYDEDENKLEEGDISLYPEDNSSAITTTEPSETTTAPSSASEPENPDGNDITPDTGVAAPIALGVAATAFLGGAAACTAARRRSKH